MTRNGRHFLKFVPWTALMFTTLGCATHPTVEKKFVEQEELDRSKAQVEQLHAQVSDLSARLETMEIRYNALNEQLTASKTSTEALQKSQLPPFGKEVRPRPSDFAGSPVLTTKSASDPEAGFSTDASVESYRKAMILLDARKYPESMLVFTQFLEQYADHPWAGSAQYYVGLTYSLQKECKLALQEFNRVLTSYDRSAHVAETLREMAKCEDELKLTKDASNHRQLLTSLFPNSPAARELVAAAGKPAPTMLKPVEQNSATAPHFSPAVKTKIKPEPKTPVPPTAPAEDDI